MNNTTATIIDLNELFLIRMGSFDLIKDQIYLFFILPLAFICVLLNCLTFAFLQLKIVEKTSLNTLIRIYTFASLIMCIIVMMRGFGNIPRYTSLSYSYSARVISCQVTPYVGFVFSLFTNLLNILIILERLSKFVIKYRRFNCTNPYECSRYLIVISCLINLLVFFQNDTKNEIDFVRQKNNLHTLILLVRCDRSGLSQSTLGKVASIITVILNTNLPLVIEMIASY